MTRVELHPLVAHALHRAAQSLPVGKVLDLVDALHVELTAAFPTLTRARPRRRGDEHPMTVDHRLRQVQP